jgi:bifunctional DNA-binding transcriptional regulator/antitoxin component of YhaV-PrlF toxin-antitoxin module
VAVRVQVNEDGQVSVPEDARRALHSAPGDTLLADVRDGALVLTPEPSDYVARLQGLHRDVWEGVDPDEYLKAERDAWRS